MSAVQDDRPEVAARYAEQLRDGVRRLRNARLTLEQRRRLRTATRQTVIGVLRYSAEEADVKLAQQTLVSLDVEQHSDRLRRDAEVLRKHGATISDRMIAGAASELGDRSTTRQLDELDAHRRATGLPGL